MFRNRWLFGLTLFVNLLGLVLWGWVAIDWAVETHAARTKAQFKAQLNHKLRLKPPPDYTIDTDTGPSSAYPCDKGVDTCMIVATEGDYDAEALASISGSIFRDHLYWVSSATSIFFTPYFSMEPTGMSFCFEDKDVAVSVLRGELDDAALLGKIDKCYLAVYKGSEPDLEPDL
jgi:hypothetical protein